jgi:hypothetical protein
MRAGRFRRRLRTVCVALRIICAVRALWPLEAFGTGATILRRTAILTEVLTLIWPLIGSLIWTLIWPVLLRPVTAIVALFIGAIATITLIVATIVGAEIAVVAIIPIAESVLLLAITTERPVAPLLVALAVLLATLVTTLRAVISIVLTVIWSVLILMGRTRRLVVAVHAGLVASLGASYWGCARLGAAAKIVLAGFAEFVVTGVFDLKAVATHAAWLGLLLAGRLELLAIGHDDAIVVFSVLEIVLCQNPVAGRLGVAGKLQIFFSDVGRGAAHLHVGSVRFKAARQRVLALADLVVAPVAAAATVVIVATATTAVLLMLTWPHWRVSSHSS